MMQAIWLAPLLGLVSLVVVVFMYAWLMRQSDGNETMQSIARQIQEGAAAYMSRQSMNVSIFLVVVFVLLAVFLKPFGLPTAIAFALGGITSMVCGWIGMTAATRAHVRTTQAANKRGVSAALSVAYNGGSVMGLAVAGIGLIGFGGLYIFLTRRYGGDPSYLAILNGFAMGASSIALFMRVGGGIYTKSAPTSADLV